MKQIIVKDELGNQYTLRFTARSVEILEKKGFDINEVDTKPMTTIKTLFAGAFLAEHKNVTEETIEKIYSGCKDKEGLLSKLVELYSEPLNGLVESGNIEWEANW